MKREGMKIIGMFFFLIGLVFVIYSFSNINGNSVYDKIEGGTSLGFGSILIIIGILLFVTDLEKKGHKHKK